MHERLPAVLDVDSLRKFFTLTPSDLEQVEHCRGPINRIGFAVQLCVLRWRGHFLHDTRDVPGPVLETIASQLGVLPMPLDTYPHNEKTRFEHVERIREHLHFRRCDATQRQRLLEHLITVAHAIPRSTALRQAAHRWLQEEKIVRPGHTTVRDVISAAREAALRWTYHHLSEALHDGQAEAIDTLLIVTPPPSEAPHTSAGLRSRSRLEQFKTMPRKESPEALLALLERLTAMQSLGLTALPAMAGVHPATRRMLANWGYRYDVWSLRRFAAPKRYAIVLCFLHAARAEATDAVIDMQDKLITGVHNKARQRYDDLLRATEEARTRAVEVLEALGTIVLDESIPDVELRQHIFARLPSADVGRLVEGCRNLRVGHEGSYLGLIDHWYGYTRQYSPELLEKTPFQFTEHSPIGRAIAYIKDLNRRQQRKLAVEAPIDFLPRRWVKHVMRKDPGEPGSSHARTTSRPY